MGIFIIKLFNLLLNRCRDLDHSDNCATHNAETAQKERDFEKARLDLSVNENRKGEWGCVFVDLYNCKERIEKVLSENFSELDKIAIASDNKGKRKDSKFTRCTGINFFKSAWDSEVNWVLCDGCNGWKHGLCELLTQNQQDAISEQDVSEFVCLSCQGFHLDDLMPRGDALIGEMRVDLNTVEQAVLHTKTVCSQFQEAKACAMGSLKRRLNDILHIIKVDRQAFRGDFFVGNHCKIIFSKHRFVCSVIKGDPMHADIVHLFSVFCRNPATPFYQKNSF